MNYIYTQAKLAHDIGSLSELRTTLGALGAANTAQALGLKDEVSRYHSLGTAYDDGRWQAQASVNLIRHETVMFEDSHVGHIQIGQRLGCINPFIGYSWMKSSPKHLATGLSAPMFSMINGAVETALSNSHIDRKTISLGTRWDFYKNMDLKAQVDFVRGNKSSRLLLTNIAPEWNGKTTVFSLSLDFVF